MKWCHHISVLCDSSTAAGWPEAAAAEIHHHIPPEELHQLHSECVLMSMCWWLTSEKSPCLASSMLFEPRVEVANWFGVKKKKERDGDRSQISWILIFHRFTSEHKTWCVKFRSAVQTLSTCRPLTLFILSRLSYNEKRWSCSQCDLQSLF